MDTWTWKNRLYRMVNPSLWGIAEDLYRDKEYEDQIMQELRDGKIIPVASSSQSSFTAVRPDGTELWIENYPYSFGYNYPRNPWEKSPRIGELAARTVKKRMNEMLAAGIYIPSMHLTVFKTYKANHGKMTWWDFYNDFKYENPFEVIGLIKKRRND